MAKLSKEQIAKLNSQVNEGITLTEVHNTAYHLVVKVNTECIVIQSMESADQDRGLLINLKDFREELIKKREENEVKKDISSDMENS